MPEYNIILPLYKLTKGHADVNNYKSAKELRKLKRIILQNFFFELVELRHADNFFEEMFLMNFWKEKFCFKGVLLSYAPHQ